MAIPIGSHAATLRSKPIRRRNEQRGAFHGLCYTPRVLAVHNNRAGRSAQNGVAGSGSAGNWENPWLGQIYLKEERICTQDESSGK
jgi:hypothetical protein